MVYPLQGGRVHPKFENKKNFLEKIFLASTTTRKIRWFRRWNPFLNPLTIKGDICNFAIGSNTVSATRRVHWRRYLRPILRTGQHLPCASFSSLKWRRPFHNSKDSSIHTFWDMNYISWKCSNKWSTTGLSLKNLSRSGSSRDGCWVLSLKCSIDNSSWNWFRLITEPNSGIL